MLWVGLAVGLGAAFTHGIWWRRRRRAALIGAVENRHGAARARADAEVERLRSRAQRLQQTRRSRHATQSSALTAREQGIARRQSALGRRAAELASLRQRADQRRGHLRDVQVKQDGGDELLAGLRARHLSALEERAEMRADEALAMLVIERIGQRQLTAQRRKQRHLDEVSSAAPALARRVAHLAMGRLQSVGHLERLHNTIAVADAATYAALADPDHPATQAVCAGLDCDLVAVDGGITIHCADSMQREIARRVLRQLANRATTDIDEVHKVLHATADEVAREVTNGGRRAFRAVGLRHQPGEVADLVGRLRFRLSYSQNQWKHAIEVGHLAGLIADELGLERDLAKRGGLLHDIGKALTHDQDGGHAVLGAAVARRCGEPEVVANSIGAHHFDEPFQSPTALVVAAADALSGARPGARRESTTDYVGRLRQIQDIAQSLDAVERVDIMSAGREVRVTLGEAASVTDEQLLPMADRLARQLEDEVTYAGQIRVTVIRATTASAIAS